MKKRFILYRNSLTPGYEGLHFASVSRLIKIKKLTTTNCKLFTKKNTVVVDFRWAFLRILNPLLK